MVKKIVFILLIALLPSLLRAQSTDSTERAYMEALLIDYPYLNDAMQTRGGFFQSYMNPSMQLSLTLSNDIYTLGHWCLNTYIRTGNARKDRIWREWTTLAFDALMMYVPFGAGWMHEEYHRAVMSQYGVNSFNEMLLFPIGKSVVSVSRERDEDMAMLCNEHHADFARLMAAGHEGQTLQVQTMMRNEFFYHQEFDNQITYLLSILNNTAYLGMCAWNIQIDEMTDEMNADERTISDRDFTGFDMTAWADALFNPEKPYEARGTHPSGVGIDRYVKWSDLSPDARKYLKRETLLDLLNLGSPMLYRFKRFKLATTERGDYYANFALRHYITAFGDDNMAEMMLQTPHTNCFAVVHAYSNYRHLFGGLEAGIVDFPLLREHLLLSASAQMWVQPEDMLFMTKRGQFGGAASIRLEYRNHYLDPYVEAGYKSAGWQAGNVYLKESFHVRTGLRWRLMPIQRKEKGATPTPAL